MKFQRPNTTRTAGLLKRVSAGLLSAVCLFLSSAAFAAPPRQVAYTITVADTAKKLYKVTARAEGVTEDALSFALPAWSPGWYVLTHAYKNIENVTATNKDGKPLTVKRSDDHTYQVTTGKSETVTLSYDLKAVDQDPEAVGPGSAGNKDYGFFAPYLDENNGLLPGPAALMYVVDGKSAPCRVTYKVPTGWKIASANNPTEDPATFAAPDYDTLADQPADLGKFDRYEKIIGGVPVSIVLVGAEGISARRFVDACGKIAAAGIQVLGNGKAPFPRYIFHFRCPARANGIEGLEHLNSTVITLSRNDVRTASRDGLSVVAHEFAHAWNVKRLRPAALGPFDYTKEVRNKDLWWLEGVTDYYAPRLIVEAGIVGPDYWRSYMAYTIGLVQNNPARKRVTLETASLKAWEGRSEGYDGLSYYEKGLVVGLLLDIEMRRRSNNRVGVDDLLKTLFADCEKRGAGYPDGEIERVASRLCGSDLKSFFDKSLRSTEELPFTETLKEAGLSLEPTGVAAPDFGINVDGLGPADGGIRLDKLPADGPAMRAGLRDGDVLVAINGKPVRQIEGAIFGDAAPGDTLRVNIRRDGIIRPFEITVGTRNETAYELRPIPSATPAQIAIRSALIGNKP